SDHARQRPPSARPPRGGSGALRLAPNPQLSSDGQGGSPVLLSGGCLPRVLSDRTACSCSLAGEDPGARSRSQALTSLEGRPPAPQPGRPPARWSPPVRDDPEARPGRPGPALREPALAFRHEVPLQDVIALLIGRDGLGVEARRLPGIDHP